MIITLALFYYIYLIFVLGFLVFTFFNIYHLIRFGYLTFTTFFITAVYIFVAIGIFVASWDYISQVNWQQEIELLPTLAFTNQ